MGIYIKGMEMPTDCHNCPLGFGGGCYFGTSADEYMCPDHGRAEWCPLIPVPPHGSLLDADEFLRRAIGTKCFRGDYALMLEELVGESITVIPAEDGMDSFIRILKDKGRRRT